MHILIEIEHFMGLSGPLPPLWHWRQNEGFEQFGHDMAHPLLLMELAPCLTIISAPLSLFIYLYIYMRSYIMFMWVFGRRPMFLWH